MSAPARIVMAGVACLAFVSLTACGGPDDDLVRSEIIGRGFTAPAKLDNEMWSAGYGQCRLLIKVDSRGVLMLYQDSSVKGNDPFEWVNPNATGLASRSPDTFAECNYSAPSNEADPRVEG